MDKLIGPIGLLSVIGLVLFFALTGSSVDISPFFPDGNLTAVQEKDFKQGNGKVEIIEYGDFECPACEAFFPVANSMKEQFGEDLTFVFRHLPLTNLHPRAMAAHRAAEAAAIQGKFWEMHDVLYERQAEWNSRVTANLAGALEIIDGYAEELGLDMDQYRLDVESSVVLDNIKIHLESASQLGVNSTPTVYVNGEQIRTPVPNPSQGYTEALAIADMTSIVENAIAGRPLDEEVSEDAGTVESTEEAEDGSATPESTEPEEITSDPNEDQS